MDLSLSNYKTVLFECVHFLQIDAKALMASHKITVGKLSRKISQTRSAAEFLSVGKVEGYIMEAAGYVRQTVMLECINLSSVMKMQRLSAFSFTGGQDR